MVLEKCYFDDIFKKILAHIEDIFDKEFKDGIDLKISSKEGYTLREHITKNSLDIVDSLWDKEYDNSFSKTELERVIYNQILILLYLYKELLEETQ